MRNVVNAPKSKLFVGTSGWSYSHWQDEFYPSKVKSKEYLEYYATQFECVELNSSFYHLPKPQVATGWLKRTPSDFKFCPKMSRWITHVKKLHNPEEYLKKIFAIFEKMKSKLGPFLIQLPPTLPLGNPDVEAFFTILRKDYGQYRYAIEPRHPSWNSDKGFKLLEKYSFAWVVSDSGGRYPESTHLIGDFAYLRFHGRAELYLSNYTAKELTPYAKKAKQWLKQGKEVWAFFNNDALCYAVHNARQFLDLCLR